MDQESFNVKMDKEIKKRISDAIAAAEEEIHKDARVYRIPTYARKVVDTEETGDEAKAESREITHDEEIVINNEISEEINPAAAEFVTIHKDARVSTYPTYRKVVYTEESGDEVEAESREIKHEEEIVSNKEILEENDQSEKKINTRALGKDAKTYELEKFEKNAMIIFNFKNVRGYDPRIGTEKDETSLINTFSKFGFEIEVKPNCTKISLFEELKKFSEKPFTDYGCVFIVVLTHGAEKGDLLAADGQIFNEQDVINYFKVHSKPTLFTKPICIIIQACRGTATTPAIAVNSARVFRDQDTELETYYLPVESDMLIFHSSFPGKPSYRPENGTWFIQTLCEKINAMHKEHHLESIFIEVKRKVAVEKYTMERDNPNDGPLPVSKQMPVVTSTLIRKLYLRSFTTSPVTETDVDIYFYEGNYKVNSIDVIKSNDDSAMQKVFKRWSEWSQRNAVRISGACVGAYIIYKYLINRL